MADEKKEPWLNWLALTTVILAVCATLSTFKGGSYSTRSVLSQTKAANQWAYYQAKSIKGYLYEIQKEELELGQQSEGGRRTAAVRAQVEQRLAGYREKLARYDKEKAEIQAEAKRFEAVRDDATVHSQTFGMAVIYLQVAIRLLPQLEFLLLDLVEVALDALGLVVGPLVGGPGLAEHRARRVRAAFESRERGAHRQDHGGERQPVEPGFLLGLVGHESSPVPVRSARRRRPSG